MNKTDWIMPLIVCLLGFYISLLTYGHQAHLVRINELRHRIEQLEAGRQLCRVEKEPSDSSKNFLP
jgi:uncharacterized integral membrane protein